LKQFLGAQTDSIQFRGDWAESLVLNASQIVVFASPLLGKAAVRTRVLLIFVFLFFFIFFPPVTPPREARPDAAPAFPLIIDEKNPPFYFFLLTTRPPRPGWRPKTFLL